MFHSDGTPTNNKHSKHLKVQTDASEYGIGGVLLEETNNGFKPVAYASRLLNKAELQARKFIVETDHRPLLWINRQPYNNARVDRWAVACLSRYPVEQATNTNEEDDPMVTSITAVTTRAMKTRGETTQPIRINEIEQPTKKNDTAEQRQTSDEACSSKYENKFINDDMLRNHQNYDGDIKKIIRNIHHHPQFIQVRYVPKSLINDILLIFHNSTFNGAHFGVKRTFYKIRDRYYWPNQFRDIQNHVSGCINCKKNNYIRRKSDGHLIPIAPPNGVLEKIAMDIVGKVPISSKRNQFIIVVTDFLSKFTITKAVPNIFRHAETYCDR